MGNHFIEHLRSRKKLDRYFKGMFSIQISITTQELDINLFDQWDERLQSIMPGFECAKDTNNAERPKGEECLAS